MALGTFLFYPGSAQVPGLRWARALNGTASGTAYPESTVTDGQRNVYTVGSFRNTIDANPGAGFFPLTSAGNDDIFVSKLDANGNFVWAVRIGSTGQDIAYAVTVDNTGLVYVTGSYTATVDFDPTPGTFNLTGGGAFAFRLNSNGTLSWAGRIGSGNGKAIAIDLVNNLIIAGDFTGSSDFDPGPGTTTLTSAGSLDIFVSKFLLDGTLVWANRMGGAAADNADGVDTDASNNIYTTGAFTGTADFNPGGAVNNLVSAGSIDAYVSKLDATGAYVWAVRVGAAGAERASAITVDGSGDVLTAGNFAGTVDFDPGGTVFNMTSAGSSDIFVLKLTTNGAFVWSRNMGGPSSDVPSGIAADATGGVYTTGYFNGTADFDPGAGVFNLTSGTGNQESFISKLTSAGNFAWAFRTESVAGGETEGVDVAIDLAGDILIAGWFEFTVDFDPGPCNYNLLSNGDDIYIMKLSPASLGCIPPSISSFSPASGPVGTTVILDGVQFSPTPANNTVYFGATRATVTAATSTSLTVTVPVGATYEPISVTVGGSTGYASQAFLVTFPGGGSFSSCSFGAPVRYGQNNFGVGLATGDLDGDGKADIAAVHANNAPLGVVQVFRNTATAGVINASSLAAPLDLPAGNVPHSVAIADVDGDGKLDIVATLNNDNLVAIYRNTSSVGSLSFAARVDLPAILQPSAIVVKDLDGDGRPDLAVADNQTNAISIWQNIGSPGLISAASFNPRFSIATAGAGLSGADIDLDGKIDLIGGQGIGTQIGVLRNISTPGTLSAASFAARVDFTATTWIEYIDIGDLDADGKPDIVASSWPGAAVAILKNNSTPGTVSFAAAVAYSGIGEARGVVITDMDGDGLPDITVLEQVASNAKVYRNVTTPGVINSGSFTGPNTYVAGGNLRAATADDIDGDGRPEIITTNFGGPVLSILHNEVLAPPTLTGFSPSSGTVGTTVTITGTNFSTNLASNVVAINGTNAFVIGATSTELTVVVAAGTTTGPISVTVNCNVPVNSAPSFTVTPLNYNVCRSVTLNGTGDYIKVTRNASLEPTSLTWEVLVNYSSDPSFSVILAKPDGTLVGDSYAIWRQGGLLRAGVKLGPSLSAAWTPTIGQWYHIALTYNSVTQVEKLYVDGVVVATGTSSPPILYSADDMLLGADVNNSIHDGFFNGKLDEVRFWNTERSALQIVQNLTTSLTGNEAGLVAYYRITESGQGNGITVANSATATGAVNNGTTVGTATTPVFTGFCSCIPATERNALIALYNSTDGANWTVKNNWLSADETTWFGLVSTGCHITEINLPFNNLVGPIPPEIGDLTELTTLRLSSNQLNGTLPDELTNLTNLEYLFINNNSIGGSLPATIGNMTSLISIDTQLNGFTGSIPASLASCTELRTLNLEGNQHTGSIPSFLGTDNFNLQSINLGFNQFDGVIPPELGNLANLSFLSLAENDLFGEIPLELGDLDQLGILDLSRNQLFGTIPSELGNCTSLGSLQLWDNQLSGGIPQEIDNLTNLSELNLSQNFLSGNIPGWTVIPSLYYLNLSHNFLDGDLPSSLGTHLAIEELYLNNNFLTDDIPQEIADLPALRILDISSNQFDQLRDFASPAMTDLHVSNNNFDFGDLELNITVPNYSYDPQALLPPGGQITFTPGGTLTIPFTTPGSVNSYQWFKGTTGIPGATSPTLTRPGMTAADAGYYTVQVTSTLITGIILTSRSYVVTSDPCSPGGPNGDNDPTFVPDIGGSDQGALGVELQSDGKIIVLGYGNTHLSSNVDGVFRLNPNGTFDNSFTVYGQGYGILVQPDNKILVNNGSNLARLNSDGTEDSGFNGNVPSYYNATISAIALQPNGKILLSVSEDGQPYEVRRLNSDGTNDPSFSAPSNLDVYVIRVQPDGKILLGGYFVNGIMRLNANGTPDVSFNEMSVDGVVLDIAIQPDGKIIAVGGFSFFNGEETHNIVRMDANGTLDPSFLSMGTTDLSELGSVIYRVLLQPDGDIILAGAFYEVSGTARPDLVRLNVDGTVDCTFDSELGTNGLIVDAVLQSNGHILISGNFEDYNGLPNSGFGRVLNGTIVAGPPVITSFSPASGPVGSSVTINGANFDNAAANNLVYFGATRATVTAATNTQLTVTVPSGATHWAITVSVNGLTAQASRPFIPTFSGGGTIDNCSFAPAVTIGTTTGFTRPALADIDGDGKADLLIPNSSTDQFSIYRNVSTTGSITPGSFSAPITLTPGDTPFSISVGDLDGDGKRDIVVVNYLLQKLSLFRNLSTPGTISLAPKTELTVPDFAHDGVIADVDGDGKLDLTLTTSLIGMTVYRNVGSPGVLDATTFEAGVNFTTGANPSPLVLGDIDGDGKLDAAVPNANSYTVSLLRNTSSPGTVSFAPHVVLTTAAGSPPAGGGVVYTALGDLDGDTKLDLVVTTNTIMKTSIYRNTSTSGTFSFDPIFDLPNVADANTPSLGDLDGDGKIELITDHTGTGIDVYKNIGSPGVINASTFQAPVTFARLLSSALLNGDIDGDGKNEIITTSATTQVLQNLIGSIPAPTLSSFTPTTGVSGTTVTLTGTNFTSPFFSTSIQFNGTTAAIIDLQSTSIQVSVPAGATTGPIQVTVGCNTISSGTNFTVCTPPSPPGAVPNSRCGSGTVVLGATGTVNGNYRWYNVSTGGTPIVGEVNSTFTTPVITSTTTYYASIVIGTCESATRTAVTATVNNPPLPPSTTGASSCTSASLTLSASGGVNGQYRWYTVATGGTAITGEVNDTYTTPLLTTTTSFFVAINDGTCESSRTTVTAIISSPSAPVVITSNCTALGATLTGPAGFTGYAWSNGSTTPSINVTVAGSYTLIVTDAGGCSSPPSAPVTFTIAFCNQAPVVAPSVVTTTVQSTVTIDVGDFVTDLDNNIDLSTLSIVTQPTSGAEASVDASFNIVVDYSNTPFAGTDAMTIQVCDVLGACGQAELTIEVAGDITVFNAVSPNGDGKNDTFVIQFIDALPATQKNKVTILNRWGTVVFEVTDYDNITNVFRGLSNDGNELPPGTYYYIIEFESGAEKRTGFISLRR